MEIRSLNEGDDRLAVSEIYEASWKYVYRDILTREYLERIPAGRWVSCANFISRQLRLTGLGGRLKGG